MNLERLASAPRHPKKRPVAPEPLASRNYRVWAPLADRLVLRVDGEDLEMVRRSGGWWTLDRPMLDGERYGYVVNGEGPFPDPRSMYQPAGVHGPSECVDHTRFQWTDDGWQAPPLAAGVLYELHVGTFSEAGSFAGAIARLPHLVELGVTHLELMPVAEFSGDRGWGYDGVDLFAPHHGYGRPEELKRLINACHDCGLAVILDVVYNHFGPDGNYVSRFGPYFNHRYHTPWGDAVNLDAAGSDEVRRFFCDNAAMWLRDYHFDGLRIDAVHALIDMSATHFLEQLALEVDVLEATTRRHLVLIAESDLNDPRVVRAREAGGYGIDAQWSDDFHHALHTLITGERSGYYEDFGTSAQLARAFQAAFVYAGARSPHRGRRHGRAPHDVPGWRFVVSAQNHDQIGNRANGERLTHLVSVDRLKIAAALLLTAPFIPMLFQGEEWGASSPFLYFTAHEDEALGAQVSEGRRREFVAFGWNGDSIPDPQVTETFERSRLPWEELPQPPHTEMLEWYRALIALRQRHACLTDGNYQRVEVLFAADGDWLVVRRGEISIACNLGARPVVIPLDGGSRLLLASTPSLEAEDGATMLPPHSVVIAITP